MIKRLVKCRKMASYERTAWVSLWYAFKTLLCGWSRKLPPSSQPTRYRTKHIRDLIISLFPALQQSVCFHFELSLAKIMLTFALIGFCDGFGSGFLTLCLKLLWRQIGQNQCNPRLLPTLSWKVLFQLTTKTSFRLFQFHRSPLLPGR